MGHLVTVLAPASDLIFFHNFNQPDDPDSLGNGFSVTTPDVTPIPKMGIQNGQAYVSQNPTFEVIGYKDAGVQNLALSCDFPNVDLTSGIIARAPAVPNNQTFYSLGLDNVDSPALYRVQSGTWTKMGGYTFGSALSSGYNMVLEVIGNTVNAYVNGVLRISATDNSPLTGTVVGMRNGNVTAGRWDNFGAWRR